MLPDVVVKLFDHALSPIGTFGRQGNVPVRRVWVAMIMDSQLDHVDVAGRH